MNPLLKTSQPQNINSRIQTALIIGAGPSGLSSLYKLKQAGINDVLLIDKNSQVGGTWANHTYPGLRCDIPCEMYSLGFAPYPHWSHTYASQTEIQQYLQQTADSFKLSEHIRLNNELKQAHWDEQTHCWHVEVKDSNGKETHYITQFLIVATGYIGEPKFPNIAGLYKDLKQDLPNFQGSKFQDTMFHSANWQHDYDFHNTRVAVIGSGASAIQLLPQIQPIVSNLYSFQQTPTWVLPKPDFAIPKAVQRIYRQMPWLHRQVRNIGFMTAESLIAMRAMIKIQVKNQSTWSNKPSFSLLQTLGKWHIHRSIKNKELVKKLMPNHKFGYKRPLLSNNWYSALAKDNVQVVCSAVVEINNTGLIDSEGIYYAVDTIIFATGYTLGESAIHQRVFGQQNQSIQQQWQNGKQPSQPTTYQGVSMQGFPNLFMMLGPNSYSLATSLMRTSEQQGEYIASLINQLIQSEKTRCEVTEKALLNQEYLTTSNSHSNGYPNDFSDHDNQHKDKLSNAEDYLNRQSNSPVTWSHFGWQRRFEVVMGDYEIRSLK